VVDVERIFQGMSPDSLIGSNLILEHLHPTARGSFLIASALARRIRTIGLLATPDQWAAADSLPDDRLWEDRAMTPFDEEIARRRTMLLTSGWPFTSADPHLRPPPFTDTLATLVDDVVLARKNWEEGHVAAAQHFAAHRDFARAAAEYRAILRLIPYSVSPYLALAQMHLAAGDPSAARRALEQSRTVEKTSYAARTIGSMQLNSGHPDSAIAELREAFTLGTSDGEWVEAGTLLGIAYARMGNTADAEAILRTVLRLNPQARDASALLRRLTTRQP
jgi:tetratricopeptide (TPR) repeat protein